MITKVFVASVNKDKNSLGIVLSKIYVIKHILSFGYKQRKSNKPSPRTWYGMINTFLSTRINLRRNSLRSRLPYNSNDKNVL